MNTLHYYPMSASAQSSWVHMADVVSHHVEILWDNGYCDLAQAFFDDGNDELRRLMEETERKE